MDVVVWLRGPGLGKYEAVFRERIDLESVRLGEARLGHIGLDEWLGRLRAVARSHIHKPKDRAA
jgi:hypothetical protein